MKINKQLVLGLMVSTLAVGGVAIAATNVGAATKAVASPVNSASPDAKDVAEPGDTPDTTSSEKSEASEAAGKTAGADTDKETADDNAKK